MHKGNFTFKVFVICMVLFCAYMQWSPVVDFDYVRINGHEHNVGSASSHQMDNMVMPASPEPIGELLDDATYQLLAFQIIQPTD